MGVGTETYRTRIGRFAVNKEDGRLAGKREKNGSENKVWCLGLVATVLLVIGGVLLNRGPQVELSKIVEIISYVNNQGKENKAIKGLLEGHKQEMVEMKKGT
jgi:hypothetical protein